MKIFRGLLHVLVLSIAVTIVYAEEPASNGATVMLYSSACTPDGIYNVSNALELTEAIQCYNASVGSTNKINIVSDIILSTALPNIANNAVQLVINGGGKTIDGGGNQRIVVINENNKKVAIDNIVLKNGFGYNDICTGGCGGAVFIDINSELEILNSSIVGNSAESGAGVSNKGMVSIINSTIEGNSGEYGAGMHNSGTAKIHNSTLKNNSAFFDGGAIVNNDNAASAAVTTITNSTVSGNIAVISGGGIFNYNGTVYVINSTLADNSADEAGGAIATFKNLTVSNSILADNFGGNCAKIGQGVIGNSGNNLSTDATCGLVRTVSAMHLHPLAYNGCVKKQATESGARCVQTHALMVNSPAIAVGDPSICEDAPMNGLDQRGISRFSNDSALCDIGAVESIAVYLPIVIN